MPLRAWPKDVMQMVAMCQSTSSISRRPSCDANSAPGLAHCHAGLYASSLIKSRCATAGLFDPSFFPRFSLSLFPYNMCIHPVQQELAGDEKHLSSFSLMLNVGGNVPCRIQKP